MIPTVLCPGLARAGCCRREADVLMVGTELTDPFLPRGQGNIGPPRTATGVLPSLSQPLVG